MSVASQLYQLQEVDTELESDERKAAHITRQLGDNRVVSEAQGKLAAARQQLEEQTKEQRALEWEIDDLSSKIKTIDDQLYGGRIRNPKELTDLQHEADILKARRAQLEEKALGIMEQVEKAAANAASRESELKRIESDWQSQQKTLAAELETLKTAIGDMKKKRQALIAGIDPQAAAVYQEVKKQRGNAVARVEKGMCQGCRITLPVTEFQRAKSGALVRCSSCGRILFLA